jgi:hypothetical protein
MRDPTTANDRTYRPNTSSTTWADHLLLPKPDTTFRYIFENIQGLPINPHSHKHHQIGVALTGTEADTFGMAELNLNFRVLGPALQWTDRFKNLRQNHSIHTYNRHNTSKEGTLYGGTAQITYGPSSHRAMESGADPSGLGRWVWTLFQGRNKVRLRVISGYRPNPDYSDRPGSVYSQQE